MGSHAIDLTGQRFGRLVVVSRANPPSDSCGNAMWHCQCDCGRETDVIARSLRRGATQSCGCLQKEIVTQANTTHGQSGSKLYQVWCSMIQRCENQHVHNYENYGGRGIDVCEEWHQFDNFMQWAQRTGYQDGLTIDRINTDAGYSPFNCRWATMQEQQRNRRNNINIAYGGVTRCLSDWAQTLGIKVTTLWERIVRCGWDIERAFTTPVRAYHRQEEQVTT